LAPVAYLQFQRSELFTILSFIDGPYLLELLGVREFETTPAIHKLLPGFCDNYPEICAWSISFEMGPSTNINISRLGFYSAYELAPTSIWNMMHWAQLVHTPKFSKMDWGYEGNMKHYNQPTPPAYNLSNFPSTLPYALFTGGNDYLADTKDVAHLQQLLPSKPVQVVYQSSYCHVDYVIAYRAWKEIYPQLITLLKKYNPK